MAARAPSDSGRAPGFTMVELMVTLAVVSILAVLSVPAFQIMIAKSEMRAVSTALSLAMTKARSEATKRSVVVTVAPKGNDWENGWIISAPSAGNPSVTEVIADQGTLRGVQINSPEPVKYLSSGRVKDYFPDNYLFLLVSTRHVTVQRCVNIDASGAASIYDEEPWPCV